MFSTPKHHARIVAVTLLFVFFGACPAWAQQEPGAKRGPAPFSDFDRDGDGAISRDEFEQTRAERMQARAAEGRPMRGIADAPSFEDLDANADGQLSPEELADGQARHREMRRDRGGGAGRGNEGGCRHQVPSFDEIDADGDGFIAEQELTDARARRAEERGRQGGGMKKLGKAPAFSELDTDADGSISRDEFAVHQEECCRAGSR